ncbi:hypothetical protein D3C72_1266800 [compost metagenome]
MISLPPIYIGISICLERASSIAAFNNLRSFVPTAYVYTGSLVGTGTVKNPLDILQLFIFHPKKCYLTVMKLSSLFNHYLHKKPWFQLISMILNSANRSKITSNFMNTQSYCPALSTVEKIRLNFSNFGLMTNWQ